MITGKRSAVLWHVLSSVYAWMGFHVVEDDAFMTTLNHSVSEGVSDALVELRRLGRT